MFYRSKQPIVVDAFRPGIDYPVPAWYYKAYNEGELYLQTDPLAIKSVKGDMVCRPGNYLIKDISGEIHSCVYSIFRDMFEPIKE